MNTKHLLRKVPSCLLGAIFAAGIASTTLVNAIDGSPPGLFELEGDTVASADPGTDWGALYGGATPANLITFTGILADPAPQTIYWKGGSKDINDIPDWWQKDGSVPDKDDITNAYAAAYNNPADVCLNAGGTVVLCSDAGAVGDPVHEAGDLIVYFGLDRYANSGDAFAGFWFFQDDVAISGSQFSGQHVGRVGMLGDADYAPGDLLVLVEYPQAAGAVPVIKVYEWDPLDLDGDNVANNLDLLITQSNAECDQLGGKLACAISNLEDLAGEPAWPYTPKSGSGLPFESFFEGGINVTQLLGGTPCFSAFLAETRASRSETATLKDFALGGFDVCGADVTKNCEATINQAGDEVNVAFDGTASNTGGLALYVELEDDQAGSTIDAVCFDVGADGCDGGDAVPAGLNSLPASKATFTLAAGQTVRYEGSYVVTQFDDQTSFTDIVSLKFFEDPADTVPIDTETAQATCPPVGTPGILVFKDCINPNIENGDTFVADIVGTVSNTGNVKLVNVMLSDTVFSFGDLTVVYDANENGVVDGGELAFSNGGELEAGEQLAYEAQVSSGTPSHANTLTASGANFFDNADTVSHNDSASCTPNLNPDLTIIKVCDDAIGGGTGVELVVDNGQVVVQVGNIITVSNPGNEDLTNVSISDSDVQTLVKMSGGAGLTCSGNSCTGTMDTGDVVVLKQTYRPDGQNILGALSNPSGVSFKNTATTSGTGVLSGTPLGPLMATATCELCVCPDCPPEP
ncbi:hypothetical protein [Pseudomonas sp. EA_105y_Pfl2_R69]|uniref:hypothetical protein n=1 Tax=Pseudomonas sp. EA_105y_Pfl2_R69 TaxID=3088683 RepID=UPI0030D83078